MNHPNYGPEYGKIKCKNCVFGSPWYSQRYYRRHWARNQKLPRHHSKLFFWRVCIMEIRFWFGRKIDCDHYIDIDKAAAEYCADMEGRE